MRLWCVILFLSVTFNSSLEHKSERSADIFKKAFSRAMKDLKTAGKAIEKQGKTIVKDGGKAIERIAKSAIKGASNLIEDGGSGVKRGFKKAMKGLGEAREFATELYRDSSQIIDPLAKLLEDADDGIKATGRAMKKSKFSSALSKQFARVEDIMKAPTKDILGSGLTYSLAAGFALTALTGCPIFALAAASYLAAEAIIDATRKDRRGFSSRYQLRFGPLPVTGSGPELSAQLNTILADKGWSVCVTDPSNTQCQLLRDRAQPLIDQILSVNTKSMPRIFGSITNFYYQLNIAKQQLIAIWMALQGDKSARPKERKGLQTTIPLLVKAVDQETLQIESAFDIVQKDIQSRYDIFGPEIDRLSKLQENSAQSIVDFGTKMTGVNQLKLAVLIHKFQNALGSSLIGVGKDAEEITLETDEGMKDLRDAFELYLQEYDPKLKSLVTGLNALRSNTRTRIKSIQENFKSAENELFLAARSQEKDFRADANRALFDIPRVFNMTMNKGMKEVEKNVSRYFSDMNTTLDSQLKMINSSLPKLRALVESHYLGALASVNETSSTLLSLLSDVLKEVDVKSIFFSKQVADTAKLQADEMARTRELGKYANDRTERLRRSANEKTVTAKARTSALYSQLVDTVADGMSNMTSDVNHIVNQAMLTSAGTAEEAASGLADIRNKFFSSVSENAQTYNEATDTLSTQKTLTAARISQLADLVKIATSQSSKTLGAAISDSSITAQSLLQDTRQNARDLSTSAMVSIGENRASNSAKTSLLQNSMDSIFGNFQSDIVTSSKQAQRTVDDAFASIDGVADMQSVVGNRVGNVLSRFQDMKNSQTGESNYWTGLFGSSQSALTNSSRAGITSFNSSVGKNLNNFLSSLRSAVSSTSSKNVDAINHLMNFISDSYTDETTHKARITMENFELQAKLNNLLNELGNMTAANNIKSYLTAISNNASIHHVVGLREPFDEFLSVAANYSEAEKLDMEKYFSKSVQRTKDVFGESFQRLDEFNSTLLDGLGDINRITNRIRNDQNLIASSMSPSGAKKELEDRFNQIAYRVVDMMNEAIAKDRASKKMVSETLGKANDEILNQTSAFNSNISDRFESVESQMKYNLGILTDGMSQMTSGFNSAAISQEKYSNIQDEKMIQIAKEIASSLYGRQMTSTSDVREKADKMLAVVMGLIQALKNHDEKNSDFHQDVKQQINELKKKIDLSIGRSENESNRTIKNSNSLNLKIFISRSKFVNNLITQFGPDLDRQANDLATTRDKLLALTQASAIASAKNKADIYTMTGRWKRLSDSARGKIAMLIDQLRRGNLSTEDALKIARHVDVSQMESAQQAVELVTRGMMEYLEALHSTFDGAQDRLSDTASRVNRTLEDEAGKLVADLEGLRNRGESLADSVNGFRQEGNLDIYMDEIARLQNQLQGNQTAVNGMMENIQRAVDEYETDISKRESDYETYIQETIDNVTANVADREKRIKQKIFNVSDTPVSLAQLRSIRMRK